MSDPVNGSRWNDKRGLRIKMAFGEDSERSLSPVMLSAEKRARSQSRRLDITNQTITNENSKQGSDNKQCAPQREKETQRLIL